MNKRTYYAFITSFALLVIVIILNRLSFNDMRTYSELVDHTRQVITTFESISNHFKSAQIYTPENEGSSGRNFYQLYKKDADSIHGELIRLKQLITDNPIQVRRVDSLSTMVPTQLDNLLKYNIAEIVQSGEVWRLNNILEVHELINRGIVEESRLLAERKEQLKNSTHLTNILTTSFAVLAVAIVLLTFLSSLFISRKSKWLESFLESILNTSQDGIVYYKAVRTHGQITDFKVDYINKAIEDLIQANADEVLGKNLKELASFVRESDLLEKYINVVDTGKPEQFETFYDHKGVQQWLYVSLAKLQDGVTATFHNITQLKKYENELKDNIKDLERSNSELEQYAYVASHDLQEPLRKIRSFGSYLQETQSNKMDAKGQEQLKKIMNSAERMSILIKDILSFSSLKKEELFVSTDLNKILTAVLQDLDLMIIQKKAIIEHESLPTIDAIPLQINQLFYNLINNSLKFAKKDKNLVLKISCRQIKENEKLPSLRKNIPYYEIVFDDNGIGFNQDYAEQIFGLFKRLNDKQSYPGSGIGLALCKKVVANHHGEILARGKDKEGACFYIYLPEKQ
jgi:PAS domain S-box-containing protein